MTLVGLQRRGRSTLALVRFEFQHSSDWSRLTINKPFEFRSFRNYSLSRMENVEVLVSRSRSKGKNVELFLQKMISIGKIYEVVNSFEFSPKVGIHVIAGPYSRTVRELLKKYDAASYSSCISNGYQKWEVTIPDKNFTKLIGDLRKLGTVKNVEKTSFRNGERVVFFDQNSINLDLLSILLSEKEFQIVVTAIKMGFFEETRKTSITDIARRMNRNKSTIDRELRSAVSKILKLILYKSGNESALTEYMSSAEA